MRSLDGRSRVLRNLGGLGRSLNRSGAGGRVGLDDARLLARDSEGGGLSDGIGLGANLDLGGGRAVGDVFCSH